MFGGCALIESQYGSSRYSQAKGRSIVSVNGKSEVDRALLSLLSSGVAVAAHFLAHGRCTAVLTRVEPNQRHCARVIDMTPPSLPRK